MAPLPTCLVMAHNKGEALTRMAASSVLVEPHDLALKQKST
jgi:hypothetical protein